MIHLALHLGLPVVLARALDRERWIGTALLLFAAMLIDLDHLLADPIYDPARCSIGFHPLHRPVAITVWALMALVPWAAARIDDRTLGGLGRVMHILGLGLVLHIVLDAADCL